LPVYYISLHICRPGFRIFLVFLRCF